MCTLAAAVGLSARYPLVIAANRDERLGRPSAGPRLWSDGPVPFVAPVDLEAGGTWLGVNRGGLFAGITNRFGAEHRPGRRSRGLLVQDALAHGSADDVHHALAALPGDAHNGFHLFYADRKGGAGVTWGDGRHVHQERLGPGLHVLTERSFGAADAPRVDRVRRDFPLAEKGDRLLFPPGSGDSAGEKSSLSPFFALLRHHDEADPLAATCVHVPAFDYGTRSSAVILLGADPADDGLHWAEGSPCVTPFDDRRALLARMVAAG